MSTAEQFDPLARMGALKDKAEQQEADRAFLGLSPEAATYLRRLFELSPGHLEHHGPDDDCGCPMPADFPNNLPAIGWLDDVCRQFQAVQLRVQVDRLNNAKKYERYTPEPGFRLEILREAILLMAQGHAACRAEWEDLVSALGLKQKNDQDAAVVDTALREMAGIESPVRMRWPHGSKHPRRDSTPGTVCDGVECGGRASATVETMLAVFDSQWRAHVALDAVHAVPLDGDNIGRAVMEIDPKGTSAFGKRYAALTYYKTDRMPGADKVSSACTLIQGQAVRAADDTRQHPQPLPVRATPHGDGYLIDLSTDGKYVEVTAAGWQVTDWKPEYPVMLASQRGLPIPKPSRDGNRRREHLGFEESDGNWHQIRCWEATAFFADHERQQMLLIGGSGSGKTKRAESIAWIVDPLDTDAYGDPVMGGPLPDDEALAPQLMRSYLFTSDNLTTLKPEDSDRLCRITTGYHFVRRVLFTTSDLYTVVLRRPGLLTGIEVPPQLQEDAQNRMLSIELDANAPKRPPSELAEERRELGPEMLGELLDDMVATLRAFQAGEYPRGDRFPIVACAAQVFGDAYVQTRTDRQRELARKRAEGETLLQAVAKVVAYAGLDVAGGEKTLVLSASELFDAVRATLPDGGRAWPKAWPSSPQGLVNRMGKQKDTLAAFGIARDSVKSSDSKARWTQLTYAPGRGVLDPPAPPRFSEMSGEADWKREERKVVGPFIGPESGAVYRDVRELTRTRLPDWTVAEPAVDLDPDPADDTPPWNMPRRPTADSSPF